MPESKTWIRRKLTAVLEEDAHPGSGSGAAGIDALVARDRADRPVIWASHLEGVLRDAMRRLRGDEAAGAAFGSAGGERQKFIFTSLYASGKSTCQVWRSAARAAFDNRAPLDETLRAIEFVPKGTRFEGMVELPAHDLPTLERLLMETDAIGHGRAAGSGRIRFTLASGQPGPRPIGKPGSRLHLLLRNLDPVSITATATPTNILPTLAFIPGRSLLGSLANWLLGEGKTEAASAVVSGAVSVSDALPAPSEPAKLVSFEVCPAPLSLQNEKPPGVPWKTPWWALRGAPPVRVDAWLAWKSASQGPDLKRPDSDLFVCRDSGNSSWTAYRPAVRVRLRNGRPDPTKQDPSLFAIEQIAEQTLFVAEVRGDPAVMQILHNALRPLLEGSRWLRIGRGGAPVEVIRVDWTGSSQPAAVNGSQYLTLVSDLLIRDDQLRWLKSVDSDTIAKVPNWPASAKAEPLWQDYTHVHGFNGTSRLWRNPAAAIRRGTVFEVTAGAAGLAKAAADGKWLGERTHEGFGRFRLDHVLPGVTPPVSGTRSQELSPSSVKDEPSEEIAAVTHSWFQTHRQLAKPDGSSRPPSLSQWLDLVSDLERKAADALPSRFNPVTAGKRSWEHPDAREMLKKIRALPPDSQAAHVRLFVRWLRAEIRSGMDGRSI